MATLKNALVVFTSCFVATVAINMYQAHTVKTPSQCRDLVSRVTEDLDGKSQAELENIGNIVLTECKNVL